jgi:hypothetical protein
MSRGGRTPFQPIEGRRPVLVRTPFRTPADTPREVSNPALKPNPVMGCAWIRSLDVVDTHVGWHDHPRLQRPRGRARVRSGVRDRHDALHVRVKTRTLLDSPRQSSRLPELSSHCGKSHVLRYDRWTVRFWRGVSEIGISLSRAAHRGTLFELGLVACVAEVTTGSRVLSVASVSGGVSTSNCLAASVEDARCRTEP